MQPKAIIVLHFGFLMDMNLCATIRFMQFNLLTKMSGTNPLVTTFLEQSKWTIVQVEAIRAENGLMSSKSTSSVERSVVSLEPIPTPALQSPAGETLISNIEISNDAENVYLSFDYASGTL